MQIRTDRLLLRHFTSEDIDIVYEINNHPECILFNSWDSMSINDCNDVIDKWKSQTEQHPKWGVFCVEEINSNEKVGMAFIYDHNASNEYEIGFRFRRSKWGNGYAQEITKSLCNYAKYELRSDLIYAEVDASNINSVRIFEKLSFEKYPHPSGSNGFLYRRNL